MIYEYECPACKSITTIVKPVSRIDDPEPCRDCGNLQERLICAPQLHRTQVFESYFDTGLGQVINSKQDIKEAKAKYKHRTGSELIEMGNDDHPIDLKPEPQPYTLPGTIGGSIGELD